MTTEHKIIGGGVFLTLIIIVGIVWFSSKEGVKIKKNLVDR